MADSFVFEREMGSAGPSSMGSSCCLRANLDGPPAPVYDRYAAHLLAVACRMLGDRAEAEERTCSRSFRSVHELTDPDSRLHPPSSHLDPPSSTEGWSAARRTDTHGGDREHSCRIAGPRDLPVPSRRRDDRKSRAGRTGKGADGIHGDPAEEGTAAVIARPKGSGSAARRALTPCPHAPCTCGAARARAPSAARRASGSWKTRGPR